MCLDTEPCGTPLIHSNRNQIRIRANNNNNNNTIIFIDSLLFTLDQK